MIDSNLRVFILFMLVLCVGLYFYTDSQQQFYDERAKPAAITMIKEVTDWQQNTLLFYLSDEAKQSLSGQQLEQLLEHYQKFGQLEKLGELEFSRLASALSLFGQKHINYQTNARFTNAAATINVTLTPNGNEFKIYNFSIHKI